MSPRLCIVIPTYNNRGTLRRVVESALPYGPVIVVCDGCTDDSEQLINDLPISLLSYPINRGKSHALETGFRHARSQGYTHALTLDADMQHKADDIPVLIAAHEAHPKALIVGCRDLAADGMPQKNSFANRFSNFWYTVETLHRLPDTQTGFRLYPLHPELHFRTTRYEGEFEYLVRATWRRVAVLPVSVHVDYHPEGGRVSHFRPTRDFLRISLLNTCLTLLAIIYGYPSMLLRYVKDIFHKDI